MRFGIVSLFPDMFQSVSNFGITGRALREGLIGLEFYNPRDYTTDRHRTVDDKPYGGGPGMLMMVKPVRGAIRDAKRDIGPVKVVYLTPQGLPLTQDVLRSLSTESALILVSGRYEGIDERLIEQEVDLEISIGDYVLSGGELAAMVLIDGLTRLISGAVGDEESVVQDSFYDGLLDYPQFTRPERLEENTGGDTDPTVPAVLLSGDHAAIARWRKKQALGRTWVRRPDLLDGQQLDVEEKQLLREYLSEKDTTGERKDEEE